MITSVQSLVAVMAALLEAGDRAGQGNGPQGSQTDGPDHRPWSYTDRALDLYLSASASIRRERDPQADGGRGNPSLDPQPHRHRSQTAKERDAERDRVAVAIQREVWDRAQAADAAPLVFTEETFACATCFHITRASESAIELAGNLHDIFGDPEEVVAQALRYCLTCTVGQLVPGEHVGGELDGAGAGFDDDGPSLADIESAP